MKKLFIVLASLVLTMGTFAQERGFIHPGGIHTQSDFERVKQQIAEGEPIVTKAYNALYNWGKNIPDGNAGATETISRPGNVGNASYRVKLAYRYAILWKISGEEKFAKAAINILNGWATACKSISGDTNAALAAGLQGYQFAQVGELMRDYSGWSRADFKKYQQWMLNVFYSANAYFLYIRNGCNPGAYWSNWGLCNAFSMMSIGILCDDVAVYNMGVAFYKYDVAHTNPKCNTTYKTAFRDYNEAPYNAYPVINEENGSYRDNGYAEYLGNLVTKLHEDERGVDIYDEGTLWLGQMQELGRDQGHCNLSVGLVGGLCESGWSQGDDLWGWMNNRLLAGIECVALFNSDTSAEVPYTNYHYRSDNCANNYSDYTLVGAASGSRGQYQPVWYRVTAHYEGVMGYSLPYCNKMALKGTSDYDWDSGNDHLGLTQLMCIRPQATADEIPVRLIPSIELDGSTLNRSSYDNLAVGKEITLILTSPEGISEGTWTWDTGADSTAMGSSTNTLTVKPTASNIYRGIYTRPNGAKAVQMFSIGVHGDCYADPIKKYFYVSHPTNTDLDGWKSNTTNTVYAGSTTTLSCQAGTNTGSWYYYTKNSAGTACKINGGTFYIPQDTTIYIEYTNQGGGVSYDSVKFVTTSVGETVEVNINQIAEGEYYFIKKGTALYWTNPLTAGPNVSPTLEEKNEGDETQIWILSLDGDCYKLVNKADERYIMEKAQFGVNDYLANWNTYNIYSDDEMNVGFQVTQMAATGSDWSLGGTYFWKWNGNAVEVDKTHTAFKNYDDLIFTLEPCQPDGIYNVQANEVAKRADGVYTITGIRIPVEKMKSGLYVVVENGKARKVAVK